MTDFVEWPTLEELKQALDIPADNTEWDGENYDFMGVTRLSRALAAAIAQTKRETGDWNEYEDQPDEALSQAALRLAMLVAQRPEVTPGSLTADAQFQLLMKGHRKRFAFS